VRHGCSGRRVFDTPDNGGGGEAFRARLYPAIEDD